MSNGIADLWKNIRGKADDPSLGYVGASMLPGIGEATDLIEIGAGLQDRSPGRVGLGIAGLALPFVGAAGLSKLFRGTRKLPMDKASRMKRAKKMGFDTPVFHGTYVDPKNRPSVVDLEISGSNYRGIPIAKQVRPTYPETAKYKGGAEDWISLQPSTMGMMGPGIYASSSAEVASGYSKWEVPKHQHSRGSRVYPLMVRSKKLLKIDFSPTSKYTKIKNKLAKKLSRKEFLDAGLDPDVGSVPNVLDPFKMDHLSHKLAKAIEKAGYEGVYMGDLGVSANVAVFDPKNIRSTWAKFDPRKRHSPDLLAGIAGLTAARYASNALREDIKEAQVGPRA